MKKLTALFAWLSLSLLAAHATDYYVDPRGNDANTGQSTSSPWQSLAKVSSTTFDPGDRILFKAGGVWSGALTPQGSGSEGKPIHITRYGAGAKPILNGNGTQGEGTTATILLRNQSYWEISDIEVTNHGESISDRVGIYVVNENKTKEGQCRHIVIRNCYVHDVNSNPKGRTKLTGGILFIGYFDSILVDSCHIRNVTKEGIRTAGAGGNMRSTNVRFTRNLVEDVFGDGMVLSGVEKAYAGYNRLKNVCITKTANYAGLWTIASRNSLIEFNEVSGITGGFVNDGEAFDADLDVDGDTFQYNYSHDNAGGFMLVMPGVRNLTVRFNISQNDGWGTGQEILHITDVTSPTNRFYNNTFYIGPKISTNFFRKGNGKKLVNFHNNIVYCDGEIKNFGGAGFDPRSQFRNNCFYPIEKFQNKENYFARQEQLVTVNPRLVAPGSGGEGFASLTGYRPQLTSPCLRKGMTIEDNGGRDFVGTDIKGRTQATIGAVWELSR